MTCALPGDAGPRGGIGPALGGDPAPAWLTYFPVADAAAAAAAAGGVAQVPDFETPFGQMARITDPNGAVFWVVKPAGTA
jgi:predicted enzyme related to lactoylglutathione lyase